ncbi:hypothetical protein CEV31_3416 [Brucella thiophenivorans]|uniref:Uncharacterized protein n=1 Tax=Brucella thiophenivorans TaxID=571255 RepID=A0A256FF66_9HYPH|nr:hypothetical protein CEV31_3416 [Brucella thiophenivorans]
MVKHSEFKFLFRPVPVTAETAMRAPVYENAAHIQERTHDHSYPCWVHDN